MEKASRTKGRLALLATPLGTSMMALALPGEPVDGKPVASWKVHWGQKAPKWPPADLVIEVWYKNPGRARTFGGTFTTPILPGQSGSSGAPHSVTINVPPVP
jgi:hypothetical protein